MRKSGFTLWLATITGLLLLMFGVLHLVRHNSTWEIASDSVIGSFILLIAWQVARKQRIA